ncbi:ABC transporter ATP-binding protein [Roseomonas elaeocarpi]|uniref:ABC transporter ATP-binding protein n=1 Tax=Roseomonas elaeocarpi TaxID=907779 RepID=A0ABV6JWK5_9PROT
MTAALLELREVGKTYAGGGLLSRRRVAAVRGVSFTLAAERPEVFAIIGESGSGKSSLARMVLGMSTPSEGQILFQGSDVATLRGRGARLRFMRRVQPIFQNPFEAFNPLTRVDRYLYSTARNLAGARGQAAAEQAAETALQQVGLSVAEVRGRFPHELSGGQLQRAAIARALIPGPALLVADEPVSMIDASLRMTIVNLFRDLRDRLGVSIIYITHDLATAYTISDRIVIMRQGEVVEAGDARAVLSHPSHPYSVQLKDAVLTIEGTPEDDPGSEAAARTPGSREGSLP